MTPEAETKEKIRIEEFQKVTCISEAFCLGFEYGSDYGYTQEYPVAGKRSNPGGGYIIAKSLVDELQSPIEAKE